MAGDTIILMVNSNLPFIKCNLCGFKLSVERDQIISIILVLLRFGIVYLFRASARVPVFTRIRRSRSQLNLVPRVIFPSPRATENERPWKRGFSRRGFTVRAQMEVSGPELTRSLLLPAKQAI